MWKAAAGENVQLSNNSNEDEWETDPDFVNNISEEEQRWGKTRDVGSIDMSALLEQARKEDAELKKKTISESQQSSYGYGGKYGVQTDRMDKSAVGHDHIEKVEKHASQKDYATGFGGKFGVQKDRMDKSAVGHDYIGKVDKHASQKDYAVGFGGKYGVQTDRMDKSAVGHDYDGKVDKHASQKDYSVGFGGKFGVQTDRVDKTAHGWDYQEKVEKHESQTDYAKGFGGKFGVQTDRVDKAAHGWDYQEKVEKHESQTDYAKGFGGKFGVQTDRVDKAAHGWDYQEKVEKHESQTDYAKGFGGKFGVQTDRQDSSAQGFEDEQGPVGTVYEKVKPVVAEKGKASQLKSRFESLAEENKKAAEPKVVPKSNSMTKIAKLQSKFANAEAPAPNTEKVAPPEPIKLPVKVPEPEKVPEKVPEPVKLPEKVLEPVKLPGKVPEPEPEPEPLKVAEPVPTSVLPIPAAFQDLGEQKPVEEDNNEWDDDVTTQHQYMNQHYATIPEETTAESGEHYYAEEAQDVYEQVEPANSIPRAGITAIAIYDYQAADEDEITFDPDDIITNIEMIDEGWWRGECRGQVGLFPANYVQVQE